MKNQLDFCWGTYVCLLLSLDVQNAFFLAFLGCTKCFFSQLENFLMILYNN